MADGVYPSNFVCPLIGSVAKLGSAELTKQLKLILVIIFEEG